MNLRPHNNYQAPPHTPPQPPPPPGAGDFNINFHLQIQTILFLSPKRCNTNSSILTTISVRLIFCTRRRQWLSWVQWLWSQRTDNQSSSPDSWQCHNHIKSQWVNLWSQNVWLAKDRNPGGSIRAQMSKMVLPPVFPSGCPLPWLCQNQPIGSKLVSSYA